MGGVRLAAALALVFAAFGCTHDGPSRQPLLDLEAAARPAFVRSPQLSPNGEEVAYIKMVNGRGEIFVRSLQSGTERRIYRNEERTLDNVFWSLDGQALLYFMDAGGDEGYHLFKLSPGSQNTPVDLTPIAGVQAELVARPARAPHLLVVALNARDPSAPDAFSINLNNGVLTEIARNPGLVTAWFADDAGQVLAATEISQAGALRLLARDGEGAPWRVVFEAPADERLTVLRLAPDGRSAIVRSNRGAPVDALMQIDLATGAMAPLMAHACGRYDAGTPIFGDDGALIAATCVEVRPQIELLEQPGWTTRLSGGVEFIDRRAGKWLVRVDAGDMPGRYIIYDESSATLTTFADEHPALAGRAFSPTEHHWVLARDGLLLSTYVTRPIGRGPHPTIITLHGGPWTRDYETFNGETQLYAERGYAVVSINFRGSTGLGRETFEAGVGEFGAAMTNDVLDVTQWLIDEGIARPQRICLMGGSYGGFAVLSAMTRAPQTYACGVDFAGPVDLVTLVEAFPPSWGPFLPRSWYRFVGDPRQSADRRIMHDRSPINHADTLAAPLLVFQGANDPRVTQAQSDRIVEAVRSRGLEGVYLLAGNEGHSFANEETALAVNRAVELFFARHLGGAAQACVSAEIQAALDAMLRAGASPLSYGAPDESCAAASAPAAAGN
ncbi:MAG: alpha/beta fold hydrolase [Hyphomonadaceae bacterium]|nr:alpha/beta fold hydrolase [Hyphomonadaceae bacterium]